MHRGVSLKLVNQREHRVGAKQSSTWFWKENKVVFSIIQVNEY